MKPFEGLVITLAPGAIDPADDPSLPIGAGPTTAALAALAHSELMLSAVADIRVQRDRIIAELIDMDLDPYRSDSNFVLFGGLEKPKEVWQQLLESGILVRDVGIDGTLRVTAGTEDETTLFLDTLREVLKG
jgi:histidinol-phosphate aminotransferase